MIKLNDKEITIDELEKIADSLNKDSALEFKDEKVYEFTHPKIMRFIRDKLSIVDNMDTKYLEAFYGMKIIFVKSSPIEVTEEIRNKYCLDTSSFTIH